MRRVTTLAVLAVLAVAPGCGTPATETAAADAAVRFVSAVAEGDGDTACATLTPDAVDAVEALRPEGCAAALPTLDLPSDPTVGATEVWGDAAWVRTGSDVVFLREGPAGWRVVAAGCEPPETEGGPYDCTVDGS